MCEATDSLFLMQSTWVAPLDAVVMHNPKIHGGMGSSIGIRRINAGVCTAVGNARSLAAGSMPSSLRALAVPA